MITLCCQNVFCFECLTTSMNSRNTCPLCRNSLNISDCKAIVDEKSESE